MDTMIGLNSFLHRKIPSSSRIPLLHIQPNLPLPSFPLKISKKTHLRFLLSAQTNNSNNPTQEPKEPAQEMNYESSNNNGGGGDLNKDQPPPLINIKWGDLLLNPNPDNIFAVGLTGLLAWASVQVLWQLFFISLAILVAALKYSFIAALLIFILVTLL
ncbi:hypothetical protein Peur_043556 [Populus x canadensis]